MRKLWLGVVAAGFMMNVGCGDDTPPPKAPEPPPPAPTAAPVATTPPPPATVEAPKKSPMELQRDTMVGHAKALNDHDAKAISAFYTDGTIVKVAGAPQETSGREAVSQSYAKLFEAFPDYKAAANRVFVKGDQVAVEWDFNATHKGNLYGIPATEKPVGAQGVDLDWFSPEGLIKEQHVFYDGGTMLSQIGISKMKSRPIPTLPGKPEVIVSKGGPEEATNVDAMKKMSDALDNKKVDDFVALIDDKATFDDYTQPAGMTGGKTDAKKYIKELNTGFPDGKHTTVSTLAVNDFVIAEGTLEGTHKGTFFGIPATKKTVKLAYVDIFQFKDGKMIHGWSYANGADFAMQLGLMPKPGEAPKGKPGAGAPPPPAAKKP